VDRIVIEPAHWQEYTERAAVTLAKTRETLREMHAAQVKAEADAAELEALRAEKAEREARERAVREAELAAARAESERLERLAEENRKAMAAAAPKAPDSEMTAAWSLPKTEPAPPPVEAPAAEPEPQPILINPGEFSRRLGFIVNAALLSDFGIDPTTTHKAAKLYHPSAWPRLCDALTAHIKAKREAY